MAEDGDRMVFQTWLSKYATYLKEMAGHKLPADGEPQKQMPSGAMMADSEPGPREKGAEMRK
jgi:hypothetical protein